MEIPMSDTKRVTDAERLIAQLRDIEASPGDLWERVVATKAREEIERLNKWADSITDSFMKERQTGEAYQAELRAEIKRLDEHRVVGIPPGWKLTLEGDTILVDGGVAGAYVAHGANRDNIASVVLFRFAKAVLVGSPSEERCQVAAKGLDYRCPPGACETPEECAPGVDMRAILVEVEDALICQDDDRAHYCPNCDRSLYNIRARVRAALAESPSPVGRPK
jgi:hypothetical protein